MRLRWLSLAACLTTLAADGCGGKAQRPPAVAVTNPYLECLTRELLGDKEPVLRLSGPGMCPGHFDILPAQVDSLRGARVLLRFDFQQGLDAKLSHLVDGGLRIVAVHVPDGLCRPDSYRAGAKAVAAALVEAGLLDRAAAEGRLADLDRRMNALDRWARERIEAAGLRGRTVLASGHQAAFCRRLGLNVAATFAAADAAVPRELDAAIDAARRAGAKLIVANRPEGRRLADALADRLGARVLVLDNFPRPGGDRPFDRLVRDNVERLIAAAPS